MNNNDMNSNNNMHDLKKEYDNIEVPQEVDLAIEKGIKKGKAYKRKRALKPFAIIAAVLVLAVGITSGVKLLNTNKTPLVTLNSSKSLPIVGSSKNLQKLLKTFINQNKTMGMTQSETSMTKSLDSSKQSPAASSKSAPNSLTDHSTTNIQVKGVDEEDLVKTDGKYIFKVNAQKIINVIEVDADSKMKAVSNITFEKNYNINGIFLRGNILVVVGNSYQNIDIQKRDQSKSSYILPTSQVTKTISYDISDKKNIKKVREIEIDGSYNSSRMIGGRVYVVTNKYLNNIGNIKKDVNLGMAYYSDTAVGTGKIAVDFNKINYMPDSIEPNYIMVAAYNAYDNKEKVNVSTILGAGNSIYSSDKNLYVAGTKSVQGKNNNVTTNTILYKFAYDNTGVKFVDKGEVPGTITNQFSMDEKDDHFRIATTEYKYSTINQMAEGKPNSPKQEAVQKIAPETDQITNNLYILNKEMKIEGKIIGIAKGEQIYSVRFINDRAYIVTFMLTDPLFVIDLKNPTSPKILGELKIPGFSNYLHPYDDTHLIGFGMDTSVINEGGEDRAKPKSMKIAIFDVSDVSKPVQSFMTKIGGAGTYSEVLSNHKALLFSKEKNLLALPVTENNYENISKQEIQGAYIYSIDLVNGIKLKGKITHMNEANNVNNNNNNNNNNNKSKNSDLISPYPMFNGQYLVDRIMYIKDTIYTLSNGLIKANDINTLKEISKLKLKTVNFPNGNPTDGVREVIPSPAP